MPPISATSTNQTAQARSLGLIRYLDVSVVLAIAPVFALGDLPVGGYLVAAVAWLGARSALAAVDRRGRELGTVAAQTATLLAARMGRVIALVGAVLVARFAFGTDDGIAAACVMLAAFTVQLLVTIVLREGGQR